VNGWEIAISAVGSFVTYGLLAVWVGVGMYNAIWDKYYDHVDRSPELHDKNKRRYETGQCGCSAPDSAQEMATMAGFVWPIGLWIWCALRVIRRQNTRRWQRRQSEQQLASIVHELEQL
jgi:hypothetical protein